MYIQEKRNRKKGKRKPQHEMMGTNTTKLQENKKAIKSRKMEHKIMWIGKIPPNQRIRNIQDKLI